MKKELTRIQPLKDFVLVLPDEKIGRTSGGILVPEDSQEMTYKATVVAVGEGKYESGELVPMKVKIGDRILHKSYGVTAVKWDNEDHFLLEERNILGIIIEEKNG